MPLTPAEAVTLSPRAVALARELREALAADGDGGKRSTRAEGRRLLRTAAEFVVALATDVLD